MKKKKFLQIDNKDSKNELFLKKINENILENSSRPKENEITSISLNKDKLYETFSLFQQFLNSSNIDNNNIEKIEKNKIEEKILEFLSEKRKEKNKNIYGTVKKEKEYTKFVKSVKNINKYNKEKNNNIYSEPRKANNINNKNYTISSYNKKNITARKSFNLIKDKKSILNNSIEKNTNQNRLIMDFKRIYNLKDNSILGAKQYETLEKNNNNIKGITLCKSNNNILDNYKSKIKNNLDGNKIKKTNSFSKNNTNEKMKEIIRNKFKKNKTQKDGIVPKSYRHKNNFKDNNYNKSHSNSCASFYNNKKKFLENNINISPAKLYNCGKKKTYNSITKEKSYKNKVCISNRNNLIFAMKSPKSENSLENNNFDKINQKKEESSKTIMPKKLKKDNININLNINQEINNISYSSGKPIIDTNFQELIKIKNIDNQNRNNNIKTAGYTYNRSIEDIQLENISNIENNFNNSNKNITMTEIKVKKKKNNTKEQIIQAKIKELNEETQKFKEERNKITLLKNEYEKLSKKLLNDIEEFNKKKEEFEKYRQAEIEIIKNKKMISVNQNFENNNKLILSLKSQNQALIQNSKNDKETIIALKIKINDLENIIKQKDNEIRKIKNENINNVIKSHKEQIDNKKGKNIEKLNNKIKNKNMKSKKEVGYDIKKLFEKKFSINNDSIEKAKDINNYTITNNFSKVYFDKINKNINKIEKPNDMNNSFSENQNNGKIKKKYSSNNNLNKIGNLKSNNMNKINKIAKTQKNFFNENKLYKKNNINEKSKKILVNCTERNSFSKKINLNIPNIKLDFTNKELMDLEGSDNNINYNTCNLENNIFKNIKKIPNSHRPSNIILSSNQIKIKKKASKNIKEIKPSLEINNKKQNIDDSDKKLNENNEEKNINGIDDNNFDFVIINNNENENDNYDDKEDISNYDFIIPEKYNNNNYELLNMIESDGKKINLYTNNKKEIIFESGVKKEIFNDGYHLVFFPNGDKKQIFPNNKTVYYFSDSKTVQTSFPDGLNIFKFDNNQIEKHYPDGSKFIIFPNGTKRRISKNGKEENYLSDEDENINQRNNKIILDESSENNKQVFMSYNSLDDDEF